MKVRVAALEIKEESKHLTVMPTVLQETYQQNLFKVVKTRHKKKKNKIINKTNKKSSHRMYGRIKIIKNKMTTIKRKYK